MRKAEDKAAKKALEKFPILFGERMGYDKTSLQQERRNAFEKGYHQAEKELIDKAIGWIEEINNHHHIMRYSDSCEPPISELIEWFKNYMKEGGKDEILSRDI